MATTTATITLSSLDLLSDNLSLSSTSTLYDAGTTTGLTQYDSGRLEVPGDTNIYVLLDSTAAGVNKANRVYVVNKNTDETHYVIISIDETVLGRLYAGDWMFIPWSQTDVAAEIVIESPVAGSVCPYEYAVLKEPETLVAHS